MAELTLGDAIAADDASAIGAWLAKHGVDADDAEYLRSRGIERLLTYRKLVRANLRDAIQVMMPPSDSPPIPIREASTSGRVWR